MDGRGPSDWALSIAGAVGLLIAAPFLYFMAVEWLELVSLGGWFGYVIVAWAVGWVAWLAWCLLGGWLERRHYIRLGEKVIRRDTSGRGS